MVFDASGSMWGQIKGVNKIVTAREVVSNLLNELPDKQRLGLMAYGHNRKGDCKDIEMLVPVGTNRAAIRKAVNELNPKGMTPMTDAVIKAANALKFSERNATVVLVSDGEETCHADPCAAAAELAKLGVGLTVHTVGFGLPKEEAGKASAQLQCMAKETGGRFMLANDAGELTKALEELVQGVKSSLLLGVYNNDKPTDGQVLIHRAKADGSAGEQVASEYVTTDKNANPRKIALNPGAYVLFVEGTALAHKPKVTLKNVVVPATGEVTRNVNFGGGDVRVLPRENGKQMAAEVHIYPAGSDESLRTEYILSSASNDAVVFHVPVGVYDVTVKGSDLNVPERRIKGVKVEANGKVEKIVNFVTGGLAVVPQSNGSRHPATVWVYKAGTDESLGFGSVSSSSQNDDALFRLEPGLYDLTVEADGGKSKQIKGVKIEAGGTRRETVDLGR